MRTSILALAALSCAWPNQAHSANSEPGAGAQIVVTGNREAAAEAAADLAQSITQRPETGMPLARHYQPVCTKVFGLEPAYAEVLIEQIVRNIRALGLSVGGRGCQPNSWVGFVTNSRQEVERLRKDDPAMFGELTPHQIERIFAGSDATQAWQVFERKSIDGRELVKVRIIGLNWARPVEAELNSTYQAGRTASPIRVEIEGSIVLFDRQRLGNRTLRQLADYATFRILASVYEVSQVEAGTVPTILSLFAPEVAYPAGLTEFDWAYLHGLYKLGRGAPSAAIHDATKRAMLDGSAERLSDKPNRD